MDERVVKFRVGVMVISTLFLGGILVLLFSDAASIVRAHKTITIHFDDAPGVVEGTPVRKSGILIGRVTKIEFAKARGVDVTVEIDANVELRRSEVPQVSGSLLGGDAVIEFVDRVRPAVSSPPSGTAPNGKSATPQRKTGQPAGNQGAAAPKPPSDDLIKDGDYITGIVAPSPVQVITNLEGNMAVAIDSLSNAGQEVGKVATSINRMLEDIEKKIDQIIDNLDTALTGFQKTLTSFDDVIGREDVREDLRKSIAEMPQLLSDARGTMNTMKTTVESVDRNMRYLEGLTRPLGERGEEIVDRIDRSLARLDEMLGQMSDFGKKLNSGEGSLGRIMSDPDLYQNLNRAAQNIAQLTCELRPIVADARVFSDKIARHPGSLLQGMFERRPGIK
jgi:phospholipid/cholesterol/gamma-HCH transport system substrate-binding protein